MRLKLETHERLKSFLIQLMAEKNEMLTFDDAINELLDRYYGGDGGVSAKR